MEKRVEKTNRRQFLGKTATGLVSLSLLSATGCRNNKMQMASSKIPVIDEADICVLGGSCTGVFAAVRAARLGAKVIIVESQNAFGGVATNSLVNVWHSFLDSEFKKQIIAGMSQETMDRLEKRKAVVKFDNSHHAGFRFNSQELKIELDEIVLESNVKPYLHTLFSEPYLDSEGKLAGVIVDNKSGRGVIKAKYFIDATGDGDLCHRLGLESYSYELMQPPTTCAHVDNFDGGEISNLIKEHGEEFGLTTGFLWGGILAGTKSLLIAGTRIMGVDCSNAADLTKAEIEGRRQIRAIMDMVRKYTGKETGLNTLPSYIGVRETRHINCLHKVSDRDAMYGKRYEDAIANGSYRFDIHHQEKAGLTFRYLDGTQVYHCPGYPSVTDRWRDKLENEPTFYQVPLRSIIPGRYDNLMLAGRMLDAEMIAYSGIRVMVNMNQLGEAAGVTSYLALNQGVAVDKVDAQKVRKTLEQGGSAII